MGGVGTMGLHGGAHLRGGDFALASRQRQHLVARGLHGARLMHVDMPRICAQHALKRPEGRCNHRQIGLRAARDEMHCRVRPAAQLANQRARPLAVRVFAVAGSLFPVGPYQCVQHGLRRAAGIIAFKMQHMFFPAFPHSLRIHRTDIVHVRHICVKAFLLACAML